MPTLNLGRVGFVNKGAYVGGTTAYKINDIVVYSNTVYACIQAHNTSHLPTDTAYWQKWTGYGASGIVNTPSGGIAATDVQSAINELDTEKQNIAPSYQGTKSVDLASASTVNIGAATGDFIHITGTTTITAFDTAVAGLKRTLVFDASLTLTHNATSLILPAGTNITTTAKDVAVFISEGSGNWRCVSYQFSSGSYALLGNDQTFTGTNTFSVSPIFPTPAVGDNSTKGATTEHVHSAIKNDLNITGSAPMYACRAWVNFNGTGTVSIRGSGNVSSITDNGTGDYTINFASSMPDVNYCANISCGSDASWSRLPHIQSQASMTTSSCRFTIDQTNATGANADDESVCISIFR